MEPITNVVNIGTLIATPMGVHHEAKPTQAVRDFEALFVETLLQHAGLAKTLDTGTGPEGGMFGELMVRELARDLAGQLHLGFAAALGVPTTNLQQENSSESD